MDDGFRFKELSNANRACHCLIINIHPTLIRWAAHTKIFHPVKMDSERLLKRRSIYKRHQNHQTLYYSRNRKHIKQGSTKHYKK